MMNKVLIGIPTYNEALNIEKIITRILSVVPDANILIIDDSSPDGTGIIADRLAHSKEHVHVLHRKKKEGLKAAYLAAYDWADAAGYSHFIQIDADGSHQPEQLPAFFHHMNEADVIIGSRWIDGGKTKNWPWYRELLSKSGSFYSRVVLKSKLHDLTSGYRCFQLQKLMQLEVSKLESTGYSFQIEIAWRAEKKGYIIKEIPIIFTERMLGSSKMTIHIMVEALLNVTMWGLFGSKSKNLSK